MVLGLSADDVSGFKLLACLILLFSFVSNVVYNVLHLNSINPLGLNAPPNLFSEARALEHVRVLTKQIDGRQEGRPGLREAALYIEGQLEMIKGSAGSKLRIEIEEMVVNGSFNMLFLGRSISLGYRNHTNIVMRISSVESDDTDPSVLVNGHYDSPLGSPGAGDCGSCIATMLELARLTVESDWVPPRPIIFLFNGAEELFMLGAHGFMKSNKWRDTIGAVINVEASGTGGIDLVCQSGPGSWPSRVYAQSAIYPMAHSLAQDVFPVIPGDTDYRIFSQDYGDIPGLDIIFLFGGYFYHTSYDTMERLLPGSIQARGDNLFSVIKAFTNSSELQSSYERAAREETFNEEERAVFFDYLSWFMVFYSRTVAQVLHSIPLLIFLAMPFFLWLQRSCTSSWPLIYFDFIKGLLFHTCGIILAIIFPIVVSIINLKFSSHAMAWFSNPQLAFAMFIPSSLIGLLIPRIVWRSFCLSQDVSALKTSKEGLCDEARFWGAFGFYAILTMAYLLAGLSGGFLTFFASASMIIAWIFYSLAIKYWCRKSLRLTAYYVIPLVPFVAYSVYFGGFLAQFIIEKMGMMGALPPPYGYFVPDVVVAAIFGVVTGWCIGPLIPVCGQWLARPKILKLLLHVTLTTIALSSQFFPYSMDAPKRVVFQHTLSTEGSNQIVESKYDFSVVDSNSLHFLFKHSPEVTRKLNISSESLETVDLSWRDTWLALFPVSFLVSRSMRFPAETNHIAKQTTSFPHLFIQKPQIVSEEGRRRVYLELSLGSIEEIWVTVINVTGPLSSWSFADNTLPAPETVDGGPPSYICRLSGVDNENWRFWLEASSSEELRIDVAVLDQQVSDEVKAVKSLFPAWVDVVAYASFMSTFTT